MNEEDDYYVFQTKLDLINEKTSSLFREPEKLENPIDLKSNIGRLDIGSYLRQPCCGSEISCIQTKKTLESDFETFITCIRNKRSNPIKPVATIVEETNFSRKSTKPTGKDNQFVGFITAKEELKAQNLNKYGSYKENSQYGSSNSNRGDSQKRKLGLRSRGVIKRFVSPLLSSNECETSNKSEEEFQPICDEHLKNIDPKMVELIKSEIMDSRGTAMDWKDIAGLHYAKSVIQEAVIWPLLRPDIFSGLRRPPKGILLFGPPGTGKTLIGKCIAHQSKSTFFSISASSLTSKWIGEGEKMVRALFAVARSQQPSVIFIDEIDSLLSQRSDTEHESSRRMKTEFLIQLDGAATDSEERILLVGATNRPQELDEAARRRFIKRIYIPLPEYEARLELLQKLVSGENHSMTENDFEEVAKASEGYSGADIRSLCAEASLGPIRSINMQFLERIQAHEVRPLEMNDFKNALIRVKSSVSSADLDQYKEWNETFGCGL